MKSSKLYGKIDINVYNGNRQRVSIPNRPGISMLLVWDSKKKL